ncbi:hypothetical protein Cgig2_027438 [Carnegiea gigantea]|uniref:Transposase MuDR plant domain-containing protein n=1 Tax=Carnegiea gigantea TaxID=171969 RepID=A0A9Q1JWR5_9CARY|nr:hypothetical protein Cgig2_027438 [Carnegiea gigantea]
MEKDNGSSKKNEIEGTKVLSVCYEGHRVLIKNVDLDKCQMLDLHRDEKRKIQKVGIELPQYFSVPHYDVGCESGLDDKDEEESGSNEEESDEDNDELVNFEGGSKHSDEFLDDLDEDDIPSDIEVGDVDDDGMPTLSIWNKVYQNGSIRVRDLDRNVSIKARICFVDKDQWAKVIREYAIQEGACLKKPTLTYKSTPCNSYVWRGMECSLAKM